MERSKLIRIIIYIFILGALYYRYFLYIDLVGGCNISLKPSLLELSSMNIKESMKILKRAHPGEYQKLCENVHAINPNYACGGFGGGCYYPPGQGKDSDEIHISTARDSNLAWTAAVIAHETCHVIQDKEDRDFSENECYIVAHDVMTSLNRY
jgi:hypothetical protein